MRDAQVLVEVASSSDVPVGFINGIEEVSRHDDNMDAPPVQDESRRPRLGFRIAGTYREAVEDCLNPSCHQLWTELAMCLEICSISSQEDIHLGGSSIQRERGTGWTC